MVSLTYCTQDLVKIDNESFELQHIFLKRSKYFSATAPIHKECFGQGQETH